MGRVGQVEQKASIFSSPLKPVLCDVCVLFIATRVFVGTSFLIAAIFRHLFFSHTPPEEAEAEEESGTFCLSLFCSRRYTFYREKTLEHRR